MSTITPGWHPDPESGGKLERYWDGTQWTADRQPNPRVMTCYDCGGLLSTAAEHCPHCGRMYAQSASGVAAELSYLRTISFRVGFLALVTLFGIIGGAILLLMAIGGSSSSF